jgi:hypothetical protein
MTYFNMGDVVEHTSGERGRIVDVDVNGDLVLRYLAWKSVRSAEASRYRVVARASLLRRGAMRLRNFALRMRDCGLN